MTVVSGSGLGDESDDDADDDGDERGDREPQQCLDRQARGVRHLAQVGDGTDDGGEHQRDHRDGKQFHVTGADGVDGSDEPVLVAVGGDGHGAGDESEDDADDEPGDDLGAEGCGPRGRRRREVVSARVDSVGLGMGVPFAWGRGTSPGGADTARESPEWRGASARARTDCARLQAEVDVAPRGQEQHCPHTTRSFNYSIPRVAAGVRFVFVGRAPISHCWSVDYVSTISRCRTGA